MINHLLDMERNIPFDFLIDGEFLRHSLNYWRKNEPTERSVVVIEYVKALVQPTEHTDSIHLDWVKAVDFHNDYAVSASFDSSLRLFSANDNYQTLYTLNNVHSNREIWSVKFLKDNVVISGEYKK